MKFDWDDLHKRGLDSQYISLTEPWEKDWPEILNVSKELLEEAIEATGSHLVKTVLKWLEENK